MNTQGVVDFGVNVDSTSDPDFLLLSGFAWAANVGWINFDVAAVAGSVNQPRVEKATGVLKGFAWGANIGWLPLESAGVAIVRTGLENAVEDWRDYK